MQMQCINTSKVSRPSQGNEEYDDFVELHLRRAFCTAPGSRFATDPATFSAASSRSMAADRCRSHACSSSPAGACMRSQAGQQ